MRPQGVKWACRWLITPEFAGESSCHRRFDPHRETQRASVSSDTQADWVLQTFPKSYQFKRNKRSTPYRVQRRMQLVDPMLQFVA